VEREGLSEKEVRGGKKFASLGGLDAEGSKGEKKRGG